MKNDRLEVTPALRDVGKGFDDLVEFPVEVVFWRRSRETIALRRCPLLDPSTGVGLENFMQDDLHCLGLGVCQFVVMHHVHACVDADVYGVGPGLAGHARYVMSIPRLRASLIAWYKRQHQQGHHVTEAQDVVPTMFGTATKPCCHLKGGETVSFVEFLHEQLTPLEHTLPDAAHHKTLLRTLVTMRNLIRKYPYVFPDDAIADRSLIYGRATTIYIYIYIFKRI